MIDINLTPDHFKRKRRTPIPYLDMRNIPQEALVGIIGGFAILLFVVNIALQLFIFVRFAEHTRHKKQWEKMLPEKEKVDAVLGEMRGLQSRIASVEKVTTEKRILWAQKLNEISDVIPRGVWLNKVTLDDKILLIDGSAVSKMKDEMINVGNFASALKSDKAFMSGLESIEVGSLQRRQIRLTEVVDFVMTIKLQ